MPDLDLDKGGRIPQSNRTYLGPTKGWVLTDQPTDIEFVLDGAGGAPLVGNRGYLLIPQWVQVVGWVLCADRVGSIVVNVWKLPLTTVLAGTVPSAANSICGTDLPTLASQSSAQSLALTGWTINIDQNDILCFNINSVSVVTQVTLILQCVRLKGTGQ